MRDAILGNVGTLISFRLGRADVVILAKEYWPEFSAEDLIRLPNYNIHLKVVVNGVVSSPFSPETVMLL